MTVLLCPFCVEPAGPCCDNPSTMRTGSYLDFPCTACGVWQRPGRKHQVCDVCAGKSMLVGSR